MIHIPFFIPLFVSGIVGALWRDHKQTIPLVEVISLPAPVVDPSVPLASDPKEALFDDMKELHHYQQVSWYAFAFALSGSWFFPLATAISIPLLSYNAYNFVKTLRHTEPSTRKSPLAIFEMIGVVGTLGAVRPVMASMLFLFVFGMRNLLLQTRNLANIDFNHIMDPNFARIWTLHEGAEIEVTLSELDKGDIIVIHRGDLILVEGIVIEGEGLVRQYSLQKIMKTLPKQSGDRVFPFTQLEQGCLYVQRD